MLVLHINKVPLVWLLIITICNLNLVLGFTIKVGFSVTLCEIQEQNVNFGFI